MADHDGGDRRTDKVVGNYHGYYNRRGDARGDQRLSMMNKDWFFGKTCLDIGCNDGQFTLQVAESFCPRKILGVDLDRHLIDSATARVKRIRYNMKTKMTPSNKGDLPTASFGSGALFKPRCLGPSKPRSESCLDSPTGFPNNVSFDLRDAFTLADEGSSNYDTILCLSVTKWIHLYHGDQGLRDFFSMVSSLLNINGLFVLEYQPWRSYEKRRKTSDMTSRNFESISIRPNQFEALLTSQYNFEIVRVLGPTESESRGFNRPMLVLRKVLNPAAGLADSYSDPPDGSAADGDGCLNDAPHKRRRVLPEMQ